MARGGNPTVIFDSKRQNVVLHFNRGMTDPDGDGNFDCIPAVDNFQIISGNTIYVLKFECKKAYTLRIFGRGYIILISLVVNIWVYSYSGIPFCPVQLSRVEQN